MGDDSSGSLEGKSLSNLRVVDLKQQLEKRGLSKSGSKKELVKRLKQKLELEKLYEESAAIGDTESKLHLDEATEQNEFVKQYLAEQQKIYARQKEVKRLIELREQEKLDDEEETDSDFGNKDQDSDVSESVSVAKNSCDSSTHAEGGEEEEMRSLSEESEHHIHPVRDGEPESSTQGDPVVYKNEAEQQDHSQSESSHSQSSMESANPDSSVSYSLADIQLPDSPKKMYSNVMLKSRNSDSEKTVSHESFKSESNVTFNKECEKSKETNGTSNVDESSNHSRESNSPEKDISSSETKDHVVEKDDMSMKKDKSEAADNVETNRTINSSVETESKDLNLEQEDVENSPERENANKEIPLKEDNVKQQGEGSDVEMVKSPKEDEACEPAPKKPKRDIEEGETDVDTESEEEKPKDKVASECASDRKPVKLTRQESQESIKSERSVSQERSLKVSSSSDSSSSHESIPKRKSYRSSTRPKESHSSNSTHRRHSNVEESTSDEKSAAKLSTLQGTPRRVKIKRSTAIVTPTEAEPKREVVRRHHKKIEIEPDTSESKSVHHTSAKISTEEKPPPVKQEQPLKKRQAAEVPADITPAKVTYRKLNVPFRKNEESKEKAAEKKSLWHSSALPKAALSISTDSLKSLIPDFKVVCSPSVLSDTEEKVVKAAFDSAASAKTTKVHTRAYANESPINESNVDEPKKQKKETMKDIPAEPMEVEENHKRTVLPEKPRSNILFIRNLVRPFTLLQLKEVLKQTGTVIEDGFWIDKIKSKCFVTYENEEQAAKTREALHNTRWPASNPKILSVEFTTQEEFDFHKNATEQPKTSLPVPPYSLDRQETNIPSSDTPRKKEREEKEHPKERERQKQTVIYIREWDKDKISQESPERERERRHTSRSGEKTRSNEKKKEKKGKNENLKETMRDEKDVRKRQNEDTPAKLLDDLFQKTKATPCIYWLPLTEEQVKQKEEQRRLRRLEREKRNQEQEEAERQARRKPRDKESRSRSRSPARRR